MKSKYVIRGFDLAKKNTSAFTLLELLVTVAVIGILTSLSTQMFEKKQRKARQAEAKLGLSGSYSLAKSFYSEYGAYAPDWQAIGFSMEGQRRYHWFYACIHFGAWSGTITGWGGGAFTNALLSPSSDVATWARGPTPSTFTTFCSLDEDCTTFYPATNPQAFRFVADGQVCQGCEQDWWVMDNTKKLIGCSNP